MAHEARNVPSRVARAEKGSGLLRDGLLCDLCDGLLCGGLLRGRLLCGGLLYGRLLCRGLLRNRLLRGLLRCHFEILSRVDASVARQSGAVVRSPFQSPCQLVKTCSAKRARDATSALRCMVHLLLRSRFVRSCAASCAACASIQRVDRRESRAASSSRGSKTRSPDGAIRAQRDVQAMRTRRNETTRGAFTSMASRRCHDATTCSAKWHSPRRSSVSSALIGCCGHARSEECSPQQATCNAPRTARHRELADGGSSSWHAA